MWNQSVKSIPFNRPLINRLCIQYRVTEIYLAVSCYVFIVLFHIILDMDLQCNYLWHIKFMVKCVLEFKIILKGNNVNYVNSVVRELPGFIVFSFYSDEIIYGKIRILATHVWFFFCMLQIVENMLKSVQSVKEASVYLQASTCKVKKNLFVEGPTKKIKFIDSNFV